MAIGTFEFSYNTPGTDAGGNPVLVPTTFRLGGIDDLVARGLVKGGLRNVPTIQDMKVRRVDETVTDVTPA